MDNCDADSVLDKRSSHDSPTATWPGRAVRPAVDTLGVFCWLRKQGGSDAERRHGAARRNWLRAAAAAAAAGPPPIRYKQPHLSALIADFPIARRSGRPGAAGIVRRFLHFL